MDRFASGRGDTRDRKLHIMIQLGNRMGLSYGGWLVLRLLSLLLQLTETGRTLPINLDSTRDRYAFPAFKLASFFKTVHFGGSMQTNPNLPKNYVAAVSEISLDFLPNLVPRLLFARLQNHLADSIVDMTYFLEGNTDDELPERALCTIRQVHVNPEKVGKDPHGHVSPPQPDSFGEDSHQGISHTHSLKHIYEQSLSSLSTIASIVRSPIGKRKKEDAMGPIVEDHSNDLDEIPSRLRGDGNGLDPVDKSVDAVLEILEAAAVPARIVPDHIDVSKAEKIPEEIEETGCVVVTMIPVLQMFDRYDIKRFVRECEFDIKDAAVRLVETAAWRGRTFPLDKRRFRIELQNAQFFHQGFDLEKNPIFYFRNMCRGPWRGDIDAVISAVLYRFENTLAKLAAENPYIKATLIILMGAPKKCLTSNGKMEEESVMGEDGANDDGEDATTVISAAQIQSQNNDDTGELRTNNPRVSIDEHWKCHTNKELVGKLFRLLRTHYPARLSKVLIVKGRGKNMYYGTHVEARLKLNKVLDVPDVREKIHFVGKTSDLTNYVAIEELCTIVGGKAPVAPSSYEF
jgi:Protein ENHANCED DISEASE RESISTANCE 2, C-terminal